MAQEIIGIKVTGDVSGAEKSVGSLKQQLREAQKEVTTLSEKFGATSDEAVKAAKKAAELKDRIGDAKSLTDAFNPDAKFRAFSASLSAVAGGFGAVQGAVGLLGVKSEEVEKTLLKVQSAMAISQGLQAVGEGIDSFKQMKAVAIDAFKGIKAAIGSTGIGLLVIALGVIVTYWDDIKSAVSGVSKEQEDLNEKTKANVTAEKEKLDALNSQDNTLKLQGKSEKEILQLKIKQTDAVITATEEQIKQQQITLKAQIEAEKRNKAILKGILEFLTAPIAILLRTIDSVGSALGQNFGLEEKLYGGIANMVFDPSETEKKGEEDLKALDKELAKLKESRAGYQLQIQNIDKKASEDRKAQAKADADWEEQQMANANERFKNHLAEQRKIQDIHDKEVADKKKAHDDYEKQLIQDRDKLVQSSFERGIANANALVKNNYETAQANKKIAEEEAQFKINQTKEVASTLENLGNIVGKQTVAGKALGIATALINTYQGASEAIKQKSTLPSPFDVIAKIANVASIVATGIKTVKAITAVQVPGGSGGSASAPTISTTAPIAPPQPQAMMTQLNQQSINQLGSATNRAYVVESDVTNSQERIKRINRAARLS